MSRILMFIHYFALFTLTIAAPASDDDSDVVLITREFYDDELVKYKGQHNIVKILVPLNSLNFDESDSSSSESNEIDSDITLFFVEADINADGSRIDQGLYVLKDGKAKKILEYGRDAAASSDDSKLVFFGAKDGLYVYNQDTNAADKYGPITDDIIAIAKEKDGDVIYILTKEYELFKVKNKGEVKEKIDTVNKPKQIVLDHSNNLYFYSDDAQIYVLTQDGVKKIEGLPEKLSNVELIKPPFILDDSVPCVINTKIYILYANGTSESSDFQIKPNAKPTAYSSEAALIQYYAFDKKIYEYNLLKLIISGVVEELSNYLNDKKTDIQTLASKSKGAAVRSKA